MDGNGDDALNPLAVGEFCPDCWTRLSDRDHRGTQSLNVCPLCALDGRGEN